MAGSLHKQCPSAYKYMLKMGFILPSPNGLRYFQTEFVDNSSNAIAKLKAKVDKMPTEDRLCTLLFDEKLISPENRNKQVVTSFGNRDEQAKATFLADHALVFMIKGILKDYQEPVSYTFSFGPTSASDLALRIKSVIGDLQSIGYIVLATICDHAENNRMAIKILSNETRLDSLINGSMYLDKVFKVNDAEVIPLYDPPHLLKGMRNHLIAKRLTFKMNGQLKTAQWRDLEMMLKVNPAYNGQRLIAKLSGNHVYPTKQGISKTKFATQIFSQTVATYMRYLADKDILPPDSRHTADLILFFDQLFDSLNGSPSLIQKTNKPLLSAVTSDSGHHQKWAEAIKVLKTMRFMNEENVIAVADIECWEWTLERCLLLMQKLFIDYKVESIWMGNFNQDVLEILFRTEVNPVSKKRGKSKNALVPGYFPGEVVTQKVIKAINMMNRQDKNKVNVNVK